MTSQVKQSRQKPIPQRIEEIGAILKEHNIDIHQFLKQFSDYKRTNKYKLDKKFGKKPKVKKQQEAPATIALRKAIRYYLRKKQYAFLVRPDTAAKFRIICYNEGVNGTNLIEAFMNAFVEGEPTIIELMKYISTYHEGNIFLQEKYLQKRLMRMQKIFRFYNLPEDWWKKYTDLKSDQLL